MTNKDIAWLSIGENCFGQGLINRLKKETIITPFSWGRSNIDYILNCEDIKYSELLSPNNLYYADSYGSKVVRSHIVSECDDIFEATVSNNFEFTHHDPINSDSDRSSLARKIERFNCIDNPVVLLYHHRYTNKSDVAMLKEKLRRQRDVLRARGMDCFIAFFYQEIISLDSARKFTEVRSNVKGDILEYIVSTNNLWSGTDQDVFWGKCDDDILIDMIALIEDRAIEHFYSSDKNNISKEPYSVRLEKFNTGVSELAKKYFSE